MIPAREPATESKWRSAVALLRCVECNGPVQFDSPQHLRCMTCSRSFPIERDVLHLGTQYEGNNAIAAEYYNSKLWPKFRFWEWVAYLPRGGERRAQRSSAAPARPLGHAAIGCRDWRRGNMPLIPRDCQVFGVDISRVLLEKCQQDYADRKIHLIVGEAESLPFPDSTFDNLLSVGAQSCERPGPA